MSRLGIVTAIVAAVFMSSAIAAATAAAEKALPEFTVETKLTGSAGKGKFNVSGAELQWTETVVTNPELINKRLGKDVWWFKKVTLGGQECHSQGDPAGDVLVPYEWHVVPPFQHNNSVLLATLYKKVDLICKFFGTLVLIENTSELVLKLTETNKLSKNFIEKLNAPGKKQEITEWENNAGEKVKTEFAVGLNSEKTNATGSVEIEEISVTAEKETELIES